MVSYKSLIIEQQQKKTELGDAHFYYYYFFIFMEFYSACVDATFCKVKKKL